MAARILVVDDDPALLEMMSLTLRKEGFAVRSAMSADGARVELAEQTFDLVVSDIYLGDGTAIDLLEDIRIHQPDTAVILVTAQGTVETAAAAASAGVFDYLAKPFQIDQLVERVRIATSGCVESTERVESGPETMIIGNHPGIVEVYKAVARISALPVPILIRGETGTGKELVARALHRYGPFPEGPFVAINCGAIPEGLLESELFGHQRGAFTGAVRDQLGAIESARRGTIFLDEVGELPPILQVKLLRFFQEGEVRPLGSDASILVPVRVVAATHRDLGRILEDGGIREDFYYRLAAYEIVIPPLRERLSDIPLLVEHFRRDLVARMGLAEFAGLSSAAADVLRNHPWPGNVRELENLVQRAMVDLGTLADSVGLRQLLHSSGRHGEEDKIRPGIGDDLTLAELERLHIRAILKRCAGNKSRAARILGIERKSLYRKAKRLGVIFDSNEE